MQELVGHLRDPVQGEVRRRQRVERDGVVHVLDVPGERCTNRQGLHVRVRAVDRGELRREFAERRRLHALAVDQARDLDAGVGRQVLDDARGVRHVAVDHRRHTGDDRVHDARAVLDARRQVGLELLELRVHVALLVVREADLVVVPALRDVLEHRLRVLAEVRHVLAGVVARLGLEVPERAHQLGADLLVAALVVARRRGCLAVVAVVVVQVGRRDAPLVLRRHHLAQTRVQVFAVPPRELEDPCLVVDAGTDELDLLVGHAEGAGEHPGGPLHAVAEADRAEALRVEERGRHRHRVRVVDELRVRAELEGVAGDVLVGADRPEEPEHAAGPHGVADGLVDPVLPGDLDVPLVRLDPADLKGDDDDVRVGEGFAAIGGLEDLDPEAVVRDELPGGPRGTGDPARVEVHEVQRRVLQRREADEVADEPEREDEAAGADDGDLGHVVTLRTARGCGPPASDDGVPGSSDGSGRHTQPQDCLS